MLQQAKQRTGSRCAHGFILVVQASFEERNKFTIPDMPERTECDDSWTRQRVSRKVRQDLDGPGNVRFRCLAKGKGSR
jgi:hypothetical protein